MTKERRGDVNFTHIEDIKVPAIRKVEKTTKITDMYTSICYHLRRTVKHLNIQQYSTADCAIHGADTLDRNQERLPLLAYLAHFRSLEDLSILHQNYRVAADQNFDVFQKLDACCTTLNSFGFD